MKSQKIRRAVQVRMKDMERNAVLFLIAHDPEAVHQLRISYKRLRALVRLARLGNRKKHARIPGDLKNIYHLAGDLRNHQLYYKSLLLIHSEPSNYIDHIRQRVVQKETSLTHTIGQANFPILAKKLRKNLPAAIGRKQLKQFIAGRSASILHLIKPGITDSDLHTLRKYLKDITYDVQAMGRTSKKNKLIAGKNKLNHLKKLGALLSAHQDVVVNLSLMDADQGVASFIAGREWLAQAREQWVVQKIMLEAEIFNILPS